MFSSRGNEFNRGVVHDGRDEYSIEVSPCRKNVLLTFHRFSQRPRAYYFRSTAFSLFSPVSRGCPIAFENGTDTTESAVVPQSVYDLNIEFQRCDMFEV